MKLNNIVFCPKCKSELKFGNRIGPGGETPLIGDPAICQQCFSVSKIISDQELQTLAFDDFANFRPAMQIRIMETLLMMKINKQRQQ